MKCNQWTEWYNTGGMGEECENEAYRCYDKCLDHLGVRKLTEIIIDRDEIIKTLNAHIKQLNERTLTTREGSYVKVK